ncbi:MAG: hypothetical protein C3F02_00295 [Parcubacteria group bacterium]|nr:MAG: hypothetical protein C3F02_00295 [Parcubacteria group bacterium]
MSGQNLTILANIRVNSRQRLEHLKDSFFSFNTVSDNWLVNVRGDLRLETIDFLRENLGDQMILFELLDDKRKGGGWLRNALEMLEQAKHKYILVWNEDHLNIAPQETITRVVSEMAEQDADYMLYTYLPHWRDRFKAISQPGIIRSYNDIDLADVTRENLDLFFPLQQRLCIVSAAAIFKKDFLLKVIEAERIKLPIFFTHLLYSFMTLLNRLGMAFNKKKGWDAINKIFFYRLRRFPLETPFELEISQDRKYILPIKVAVPKTELFVCLDDDINYPGSQLIKRGLYPLQGITMAPDGQVEPGRVLLENNDYYDVLKVDLGKNKEYTQRYYQDEIRINVLLKETIFLIKGSLSVSVGSSQKQLAAGQSLSYYPNIRHTVRATEDSVFILIRAGLQNKKIKFATD